MIEIGLCADENFAMPCGVCITSIFESNKNNKIRVHILTDGFSDENILKFEKTASRYKQVIEIHNIDDSILNGLHIIDGRYPLMMYARLLFPQILDKTITKLIYLDCDIAVIGDIEELWNIDVHDYACGAIPDTCSDDIRIFNRIGIYDHTYINSGVLLMNLQKWRNDSLGNKCIEYAISYSEKFIYPDQDTINAVLCDKIKILDFKYNVTTLQINNNSDLYNQLFMHKKWWKSFDDARMNPIIIHYATTYKPWHKEYNPPIKKHFLKILEMSEWHDYKIKYRNKGMRILRWHLIQFLKICKSKMF